MFRLQHRLIITGLVPLLALLCSSVSACPSGYYNSCFLGACVCLPNSGTVIRAPVEIPRQIIERAREDPVKILVNPAGFINQSGVPTPGDFVEFVIKSPDKVVELIQNPGQWPYAPVAAAIISARNAVVTGGGRRIPPHVHVEMRRWYPDDLLNSVRWTTNWGPLRNTLQAAQMSFNPNTQAIALINAVVFRDDAVASDPVLWAHELYHIQQYRAWGVFGFAKRWVDNSSDGGPIEAPAYARGEEAKNVLAGVSSTGGRSSRRVLSQPQQTGFASGTGMQVCGCWGPNPASIAQESRCSSGRVRLNVCPSMCAPGHPAYAYVCL